MARSEPLSGVLAPVITPFDHDLEPDAERLARQCRWLLSQGVGLAVFGTNSEANSMSMDEKKALLDRLVESGIDPRRMMPGTGACALSDTVALTRHAVGLGCAGVLMLPPFYYKGVSDDGLFRYYSEVIERVGSAGLRLYLYHIPPVAQVGISLRLIERLLKAWPGIIAGIKDSSGDWENTHAMLAAGWEGFSVFSGSEIFLLRNLRAGGAGCISALANIAPSAIERLFRQWREADADTQQQRLVELRNIMQKYPMISALKAVVAHFGEDPSWNVLRPPLTELNERQRNAVIGDVALHGLTMPGFPKPVAA